MPELPEVESVVRRIRPTIEGARIENAQVLWQRTIGGMSSGNFLDSIKGKVVFRIFRRAKYIVFELRPTGFLLVHLRMSGDIFLGSEYPERDRHQRIVLEFSGRKRLRFIDARKFGRFIYESDITSLLSRLGPEPIDTEFPFDLFCRRLKTTRRPIKTVLLDQAWIAGLGNIYVLESLWRAGINPRLRADRLSRPRVHQLIAAASAVLHEAIECHGTDIGDGVWKTGTFRPQIYGREGLSCLRCSATVKKIRLAQRGTEYCPRCQRR